MYSLHNKFHVDFVLLVWNISHKNSFFNIEDVEDKSNAPTVTSGVNINKHTFKDLRDVQRSYPKNVMAAHMNINSLRYKFDKIKEVLTDNIVDLLIISETKLDESFNDNLFSVDAALFETGWTINKL
jgi:hypothetical protein